MNKARPGIAWSIAKLTYTEAVRQPVSMILFFVLSTFSILLPILVSHTLDEASRLVADSLLALHLLGGFLLAGFSACYSIRREISRGTALTVLSKPLSRTLFLFAKFLGVAAFTLLYALVMTAITQNGYAAALHYENTFEIPWGRILPPLAALFASLAAAGMMNLRTGRPFTSAAIHLGALTVTAACLQGIPLRIPLAEAGLLIALAGLVFSAAAAALAPRLETAPVIGLLAALFLLGITADYLAVRAGHPAAAWIVHTFLPHWQVFWIADALHADTHVPASYLLKVFLQSTLYAMGILLLGAAAFEKTEIK